MPRTGRDALGHRFGLDHSESPASARLIARLHAACALIPERTVVAGLEPDIFAPLDWSLARQLGVALAEPVAPGDHRRVHRIVTRHAAVVASFLECLSTDRHAVAHEFAIPAWEVVELIPIHSFDEVAGITAVELTFAGTARIAYEPSAVTDALPLFDMIAFLSSRMSDVDLRGTHTMERVPHAWMSHPARVGPDCEPAGHLSRGAGALLAAALLLDRRIEPHDVVTRGGALIVTRVRPSDRRMAFATRGDLPAELASSRAGFGDSVLHAGVLTQEFFGGHPRAIVRTTRVANGEAHQHSAASKCLADRAAGSLDVELVVTAFMEACAIVARAPEGTSFERGAMKARKLVSNRPKMAEQVRAVRASLHFAAGIVGPVVLAHRPQDDSCADVHLAADPSRASDFWLGHADAIAASIATNAVRRGRSEMTWLSVAPPGILGRRRIAPIGLRLCDGQAGIAFLFAALAARGHDKSHEETARAALAPIRRPLRRWCSTPSAADVDVGGSTGLGSIIYTLTRCAVWLGDPTLTADAMAVAERITPARIARVVDTDVMCGVSGLLFALLALNAVESSDLTLGRAIACGERLLATLHPGSRDHRAGRMQEGHPVSTGFGHGMAGTAAALARLAAVTGDSRFLTAARERIAVERAQFVADGGVWLDPRVHRDPGDAPVVYHGWCTGAPGIALGRLSVLRDAGDDDMRREIDHALTVTSAVASGTRHHLCCGAMAIVESDLVAAEVLNRPALRRRASMRAVGAVCAVRAHMRRGRGHGGGIFHPSMLEGMSGIAFQCLRLAAPDAVPSPLLFD